MDQFIQQNINNLDPLQIDGFHNLPNGLAKFFEEETMHIHDDHRLELFSSAALESTDIIRASSNFHGKPMFSNVIISSKAGEENVNWYGLVSNDFLILCA